MKLGTFFEHFDLLAEAPNAVQKLRELILDLAVRGKLVSQDANDEPAAVLLERIKKEKERLVKEGKVSKSQLSSNDKNENEYISFTLPKIWKWATINDITSQVTDGEHATPPRINIPEIPLATAKNVRDGYLDLTNTDFVSYETAEKCWKRCEPIHNDILMVCVGATTGRLCLIKEPPKITIVRSVALIRPFANYVYPEYIALVIKSPIGQNQIWNKVKQSAQPCLYINKIQSIYLSIPPLNEQKRIVAKVDELMKLCDELEARQKKKRETRILINNAALNKLLTADTPETFTKNWQCIGDNFDILYSAPENIGKLRQAILQLAVMGKLVPQDANDEPAAVLLERIKKEKERLIKEGKIKKDNILSPIKDDEIPFELPIGWEWVRVIDIVDIGTGSTPATTNPEYYGGNIPWYTSSATNNYIAEKPQVFITEKALKETNCKIFPSGSLIIALYGQGKTRGQISEIMIAGATNQAIAAMVFFESSKELKKYIKYYFLKIYDEIRNLAEGGAQPNLNVGKIKNTLIPIPPFNEQKRIVTKVDKLMKLCDELETKLTQTQTESEKIINAAVKQLLTV
ncbi:MAG: restriction endonuclease [Dolichospermum sp. DEX182a]|nr:restriction endonuclease [Dolichospermum sp. DEX182a]